MFLKDNYNSKSKSSSSLFENRIMAYPGKITTTSASNLPMPENSATYSGAEAISSGGKNSNSDPYDYLNEF